MQTHSNRAPRLDDSQAFAIANAVLFLLTRLFFTAPPYLLLWLTTELGWMLALPCAVLAGYGLQLGVKAMLREED